MAQGFFREYLPPTLVRRLNLDTLSISKVSFIEKALREHFSDLLYTVHYRDRPLYIYLLLEHKSHPWRWVGLQLLGYLLRIWELYRKQNPKANKLPPILPLVLYQGKKRWRIAPNFQALIEGLDDELRPYVPEFRYQLHDLSSWDSQTIQGEVLTRLVLLAMKHVFDPEPKAQLREILRLIREVLQQETALELLEVILRYYVQYTQRLDEDDVKQILKVTAAGEELMQTFIDRYIEEGERRGRLEGKLEGVQLGEATILLRQIELKFGAISEQDRRRIESAEAETLLKWSERVLTAESLDQLFH